MKILLLGAGLQGKAALYDLDRSPDVTRVIAADIDIQGLSALCETYGLAKVEPIQLDAHDRSAVRRLLRQVQAAIVLLPPAFRLPMAELAVEAGVHVVDASYALPEYKALHQRAIETGAAILPECGLDPGIDLVLAGQAIGEFDTVLRYDTYGAGIPEPAAAGNPLNYKISWTFAGVLGAYTRPARVVQNGQAVDIPGEKIFAQENIHRVSIAELGALEAYPNGDPSRFLQALGITDTMEAAGRYSLRWPGHAAFWEKLGALGFLSDHPVRVGAGEVVPRAFLHDLLHPQLQYEEHERDIALVRVEVSGLQSGEKKQVIYQVLDYRDLETGFLAMQRTVGFTASLCAQMLLRGEIQKRGLLSPLTDIPPDRFIAALAQRGIRVQRREILLDQD